MFISMLDGLQRYPKRFDLSSLRTGFISGAGCPEALMQRVI
jgi:hypothetical protein